LWLDDLEAIMSGEMRDDGHEPATKADLRAFAANAESRFATKTDLTPLATKLELQSVRNELSARLDDHDRRFDGIDGNLRRLNIGFAKMDGDMTELKSNVGTLLENFSRFSTILERASGNIEASLRKMDLQGSMLMEHEDRLKKLESRPS
jgi:chromosome segregation ATPase